MNITGLELNRALHRIELFITEGRLDSAMALLREVIQKLEQPPPTAPERTPQRRD